MRIRTLVPALACLAAAPIYAADVVIDGFVDTVYSTLSTDDKKAPANGYSETGFVYAAKLGVVATISDKVSAGIDIFHDGSATGDITFVQAYGAWKVTDQVELKTGKFISDIGFVGTYAPDLWRINKGPIFDLYGNDVVGARAGYAHGDLSLGFTVANGVWTGEDTSTDLTANGNQVGGNAGYGYILDATYVLPDKKGSVNAELAYDTLDAGQSVLHFGLNALVTPAAGITAGAELIYQQLAKPDGAGAGSDDQTNLGLLAMVNVEVPNMPLSGSVTAMVQYLSETSVDNVKDDDRSTLEVSLALLTTPIKDLKDLALNFELAWLTRDDESKSTPPTAGFTREGSEYVAAVELLYVF